MPVAVAVKSLNGSVGAETVTVGGEVYPLPESVIKTLESLLLTIVALALAVEPPTESNAEIVIVGGDETS